VADQISENLHNQLGIAVAKRAYRIYSDLLASDRWQRLSNEGARPQRMLWASTGAKDPNASDTLYIEALAAPFTINTMPEPTLLAFADHGKLGDPLAAGGGDAEDVLARFAAEGIDVDQVAAELQQEGKKSFDDSWKDLLGSIDSEVEKLQAA
jgi:transaldolase